MLRQLFNTQLSDIVRLGKLINYLFEGLVIAPLHCVAIVAVLTHCLSCFAKQITF